MISRRAPRSASSSSPVEDGAPAARITFPPSGYTSLPSQCTPWRSTARPTTAASACSRSATAAGPRAKVSSSTPTKPTKATLTRRCSPGTPARIWSRWATGKSRSMPAGGFGASGRAEPGSGGAGTPRRMRPSVPRGPSHRCGRSRAVESLTMIWPAAASASQRTVVLAAGPHTISSRWPPSTRNREKVPEWAPTDMRSRSRPPWRVVIGATTLARMPAEARQARAAWSSPVNSTRSASPPNLRTSPPSSSHAAIIRSKHPLSRSVSSSAPARPSVASSSESRVKPEMSADTRVPSTRSVVAAGRSASQVTTRRDTYGMSSAGAARTSPSPQTSPIAPWPGTRPPSVAPRRSPDTVNGRAQARCAVQPLRRSAAAVEAGDHLCHRGFEVGGCQAPPDAAQQGQLEGHEHVALQRADLVVGAGGVEDQAGQPGQ